MRGKRPADDPLPEGARIDTRKHRGHVLSPQPSAVQALLGDGGGIAPALRGGAIARGSDAQFRKFARSYEALLAQRFAHDRAPFDALARKAQHEDVYLGCNCPTRRNPDVRRCHTVLALRFMQRKYPSLRVQLPAAGARRGRG